MSDIDDLLALPSDGHTADMLALPEPPTEAEQIERIKRHVCDMLNDGLLTPTEINKSLKITKKRLDQLAADDAKFKDELTRARENNNAMLEDLLLNVHNEHLNPAMAKVRSENIKWVLGVRDRSRYGTKIDVTDTNSGQLVDVLRMAIARIPRSDTANERPIELIEAQAIEHKE
ncbi:hypothetical protein [Hyphomicrobium sp. DY-1]|uniref:terminase small subunit-like protein n=1 Tax=Hyphomicrobium sp. DY-1 TaxID=3075650 RepID=UPI0039C16EB2